MTNPFSALGLPEPVVAAVSAMGYRELTPIQQKAIPALLENKDVLAAAQTGTGKTAAFALPVIAKMLASPKKHKAKSVRSLILAPTRELAAQIDENIRAYCANTKLTTVLIFGGVNIRPQTEALSQGADFLVATPGRLLDHLGQKNVDLSEIEFFVLDEADRMLDMGFIHDIRKVLRFIPAKRQTLLFSATFSDEIKDLAQSFLTDPVTIEIARNKESTLITQQAWAIAKKRKRELLRDLIVDNQWDQVLVFARMKHTANRIASQLEKDGIVACAIHGNKSQSARTKALSGFKNHTIRVLVATDIAARGLDIEGLPHVVNFELPNVAQDYVHRIGRTGRAGVAGHAVSLVSPDEEPLLLAIEKLLKRKIELKPAHGYEGDMPEDIARDEALRDKARTQELERLRQSRRQARDKNKKQTKKTAAATEIETLVQEENKKANLSVNPQDRFEKKICRKAPEVIGKVARTLSRCKSKSDQDRQIAEKPMQSPNATEKSFKRPVKARIATLGKHCDTRKLGNARDNQPRRSDKANSAQWQPRDPFAPKQQAIFLSQSMPSNKVADKAFEAKSSAWKRQDAKSNARNKHDDSAFRRNRNEANIKSTVTRRIDTRRASGDGRFESVSSNLPPGMVLRYRRR